MKSFKRILVLALAVVMCLTAFAISSSAAGEFKPEVKLLARYNETGDKIIVTVTTDKVCGALMGTLILPEGVSANSLNIELADSKFIEDVNSDDNKDFYTQTENAVTFAVVTDKVAEGSTTWADIYFALDVDKLDENTNFTFKFQNVQVCNINEELANGITVSDAKVEIPFVSLRALGAKKQSDANAILFGSRVDLTGSTTDFKASTTIKIGDEEYQAKSCGYAYAYTSNVSADFDNFGVKLVDGKVQVKNSANTLFFNCKKYKYWDEENGFFVYTLKIEDIKDANLNREISVRPYVVYADEDGNKHLMEGNVISRSCDGVASAPNFLGNEEYKPLW